MPTQGELAFIKARDQKTAKAVIFEPAWAPPEFEDWQMVGK